MTQYVAIMNTPGYMPWSDDEPAVFDSASDAWAYLADERRKQEDQAAMASDDEAESPYSDTVDALDALARTGFGPYTLYGDTPGYDGNHDLGVAYSVDVYVPEEN